MNSSEKKNQLNTLEKAGRIVAADFGRGLGLWIILILHLYNYWGKQYHLSEIAGPVTNQPIGLQLIIVPLQFLGSWASIFALLTGISTAYTMHYMVLVKKVDLKKRLLKTVFNAVILLIINIFYIYLFIYPSIDITGLSQQGLIPASIKAGKLVAPETSIFLLASPLSMIAFSNFFIIIVCIIIWNGGINPKKNILYITIFGIIGGVIVLTSQPMSNFLIPIMETQYEEGNYFAAMCLAWMVGPKLSIFPYVGFAFFGGMLGIFLRQRRPDFKKLRNLCYSIALIAFILVIINGETNGYPTVEEIYDSIYFPYTTYMVNLGAQMIIAYVCINKWDTHPIEERRDLKTYPRIITWQRMGMISLTIFMLEETTAALYTRLFVWMDPNPLSNKLFVLLFWVPFYVYLWMIAVNRWEKHFNFKYSIEWFLTCLIKKKPITTNEDILQVKKIIYIADGYENKEDYFNTKKIRKEKGKN
jgi:hypothetical protein